MFALAGVVFALVVALLLLAIFRRRRDVRRPCAASGPGRLVSVGWVSFIVLGGLGLPLVILAPLLVVHAAHDGGPRHAAPTRPR